MNILQHFLFATFVIIIFAINTSCKKPDPVSSGKVSVIQGSVKSKETGTPMKNVLIKTVPASSDVYSDANGKYSIEVNPGTYFVTATLKGYNKCIDTVYLPEGYYFNSITLNLEMQTSWHAFHSFGNSVNTLSPSAMCAVGNDLWVVGSQIWRYDGNNWINYNNPSGQILCSVKFNSGDVGWAVCEGGAVLKYNGSSWTYVTNIGAYIKPVLHLLSNGNIIIISRNSSGKPMSVKSTNGGSSWIYNIIDNYSYLYKLIDCDFVNDNLGFVLCENTNYPTIYKYDNNLWSRISIPDGYNASFDAISATNIKYIANLYSYSNSYICTYDSYGWYYDYNFSDALYSISMLNDNFGWAGGIGKLYLFNGENWAINTSAFSSSIYCVKTISETSGWALCEDGVLLRYYTTE